MNGPSDVELLRRIADKDAEALEALYDRYERAIYTFAYRMVRDPMTAEEIVQELFMRIWNAADRYQSGGAKPSSWMFAITRNIGIDMLRRKKSRMPEPEEADERLAYVRDASQNVEANVELRLLGDQIRQAMRTLNEDQQDVLELIYYQGLTHQEVCEQRAIPLGTVKSRVRLAMKQLRERLIGLRREETTL